MTEITLITDTTCPACGHHVSVPFFDGGMQPLATIAWPDTAEMAKSMKRLPNDFVSCVECGHIFNRSFSYREVPYTDKPNLMFNKGTGWAVFIREIQQEMMERLPAKPTVLEIGHGDGSFLATLASMRPEGTFIGFDPHGAVGVQGGAEFRAALFVPMQHLPELKPDLIIMRHVLEHFESSLSFLQQLSFAASFHNVPALAYLEVPCVDRVFSSRRTVDFYYEHNSQFTTHSFTTMLGRASLAIEKTGHGYDGEVVYGLVKLASSGRTEFASKAQQFREAAIQSKSTIEKQLAGLLASGKKIAVWGGTGKSAAFMHRYALDAERFPAVVDSDKAKTGTFVPGTGQVIVFCDWLLDHPHDIIIVPPQWRAADILAEIRRKKISFSQLLIEHGGRLIDFINDEHPYRKEAA